MHKDYVAGAHAAEYHILKSQRHFVAHQKMVTLPKAKLFVFFLVTSCVSVCILVFLFSRKEDTYLKISKGDQDKEIFNNHIIKERALESEFEIRENSEEPGKIKNPLTGKTRDFQDITCKRIEEDNSTDHSTEKELAKINVLLERGKIEEAREECARAVEKYPESVELLKMHAELCLLLLEMPKGVKMEMVFVPRGIFKMGLNDSDKWKENEKYFKHVKSAWESALLHDWGGHDVKIEKSFYIGKYEVTCEQWMVIMGYNPNVQMGRFFDEKYPVVFVSWNDCQDFTKKLSEHIGDRQYFRKEFVIRLPSDGEWEYACRAGTKTRYCSGDSTEDMDKVGWSAFNYKMLSIVGQKRPNSWKIHDMHGNVAEWCMDDWRSPSSLLPAQVPFDGSPWYRNGYSPFKLLRGGSSCSLHYYCRSAARSFYSPSRRYKYIGFRIIMAFK